MHRASQPLRGTGTVLFGRAFSSVTAGGGTLTIGLGVTVRGLSGALSGSILNHGTVAASTAECFFLLSGPNWHNQGTVRVQDGGTVLAQGFNNAGSVTIAADSSFSAEGDYTQTAGTATLADGVLSATGTVDLGAGSLSATGTLTASLVRNAGLIEVGGTRAAGLLTIDGNYLQTARSPPRRTHAHVPLPDNLLPSLVRVGCTRDRPGVASLPRSQRLRCQSRGQSCAWPLWSREFAGLSGARR